MLTAEQLELRRGKITSSTASAALGLHPYITPMQAWERIITGEEGEQSAAGLRGDRLEPLVLDHPAEVLGLERRKAEFRSVAPWAGDHTDALYYRGDELVLIGEGKTAAMKVADGYGEEGTDQVPDHVVVQCAWHLAHWPEVNRCVVPVLVGGYAFEFRLYYVQRNSDLEGTLLDDLAKWHRDHVVANRPPPARAGDCDVLQRLWPKSNRKPLQPTPDLVELAKQVAYWRQLRQAAEKSEENAKAQLRAELKEFDGFKWDGGSITYRNKKDSEKIDWQAIARELGAPDEIIQKHTRIVPGGRVLTCRVRDVEGSDD